MSFYLEKLPSGDLKLKIVQDAEEEDRDWDRLVQQPYDGGIAWLMEESGYLGNGWSAIDAEWTGDLTDAPMICDDCAVEDNGDRVVYGSVWWFPRYEVEDPVATLRDRGEVVFALGHRAGELVPREYRHKFDPVRYPRPYGAAARPHGLCENREVCVEHAANRQIPSCKRRGRGRRTP